MVIPCVRPAFQNSGAAVQQVHGITIAGDVILVAELRELRIHSGERSIRLLDTAVGAEPASQPVVSADGAGKPADQASQQSLPGSPESQQPTPPVVQRTDELSALQSKVCFGSSMALQ